MKRLTYRYPMTNSVCTKYPEYEILQRLCELEDALENGTLKFVINPEETHDEDCMPK